MTKSSQSEMRFFEHLEVFRSILFKCAISISVFFLFFFLLMEKMFDEIILAPCHNDFFLYKWICELSTWCSTEFGYSFLPDFCKSDFDVKIINIKLASQFLTHMSTSFWFAVLSSLPIILYFLWEFANPAFYPHERKYIKWTFLLGGILFLIGVITGYAIVFPLTLRFLVNYNLSSSIENQLSLDSYISNFFLLTLIMGALFEIPIVALLLSRIGLLTKEVLCKYRRQTIVALLILAAVITPSGDPFTLMVVFLPIWLLYEFSILLVKQKQ